MDDALISAVKTNNNKQKSESDYYRKYLEMSTYENELLNLKVKHVAGIDEAGRGPLAGPVVASCVILPHNYYLLGLDDSKKLSEKKRGVYYEEIIKNAVSYGVGIVDVCDIDKYNIFECTKIAMLKSVANLKVKPGHLLIDAMRIDIDIPQTSIIKGDTKSVSIAAASILAKVTRDKYMIEMAKKYPEYHFEKNKGYGTKEHLEALKKYGATPLHRQSFEPVKYLTQKTITLFNFE